MYLHIYKIEQILYAYKLHYSPFAPSFPSKLALNSQDSDGSLIKALRMQGI